MRRLTYTTIALGAVLTACLQERTEARSQTAGLRIVLPNRSNSVRFAVIGDMGTGNKEQYEVGQQMALAHQRFPFDFVLMLGDNIYGGKTLADYRRKFEDVYKPLTDEGVKFYASLGNHDDSNEKFYKPFNMNGQRYYRLRKSGVDFFALDSTYMDPSQMKWLKRELAASGSGWKICFFHHPLYSDAKYHGPDMDLRARLEPIFEKFGVRVVLSGHEHVYERIKPHGNIFYFVMGNAGQLRPHDLKPSEDTAEGFDTDQAFMLVEIAADSFYFQTISRTGKTVDSGVLQREPMDSVSR
jgi:3',5'-cyclic AMP phosphodiesterase CpdA